MDVPRPLTNDLWVVLFQTIDVECVKGASPAGTNVYVKALIVNVNKCLKTLFSRTTYEFCIDVPRPLINDLWVFLFQTIDAECLK